MKLDSRKKTLSRRKPRKNITKPVDPSNQFDQKIVKFSNQLGLNGWYIIDQSRLRKITSPNSLELYKAKFGEIDYTQVPSHISARRGALAPTDPDLRFSNNQSFPSTAGRMREFICSSVSGSGYEFGAGGRPMITPIGTKVTYVDRFSNEEMREYSSSRNGTGVGDFMPIDIVDSIEKMEHVTTADFIIASHVIEHVSNPIGMLEKCYSILKPGGKLILMIPDKKRTHDRNRNVTSIPHFIADFISPSPDRDLENYIDKYMNVEKFYLEDLDKILESWKNKNDIHLHTFTHDSALELFNLSKKWAPFSEIWSHPGDEGIDASIEMYFILTK